MFAMPTVGCANAPDLIWLYDYTREAVPPIGEVDAAWVYELLKEQRLH
ncbi:MAG: hypothetical protein V7L29_09910 [Nostoc sp.]